MYTNDSTDELREMNIINCGDSNEETIISADEEALLRKLLSGEMGDPDYSYLITAELEKNDTENDYHNKGAQLAKDGDLCEAINVCIRGLEKFPHNIDLIADIIKYSSDIGELEVANTYLDLLSEQCPKKIWNWRAYTFTLDFLLQDPIGNENVCREIIDEYKKNLPHEEKSYFAESILEEKLGNHERSMKILSDLISERYNAPQCALRLLDQKLQQGEYGEVIHISDYYSIASCETQPSTQTSYVLYARCLAEDAILHMKYYDKGSVTKSEIDRVRDLYEKITDFPQNESRFGSEIQNRIVMLDLMMGD